MALFTFVWRMDGGDEPMWVLKPFNRRVRIQHLSDTWSRVVTSLRVVIGKVRRSFPAWDFFRRRRIRYTCSGFEPDQAKSRMESGVLAKVLWNPWKKRRWKQTSCHRSCVSLYTLLNLVSQGVDVQLRNILPLQIYYPNPDRKFGMNWPCATQLRLGFLSLLTMEKTSPGWYRVTFNTIKWSKLSVLFGGGYIGIPKTIHESSLTARAGIVNQAVFDYLLPGFSL